MPKARPVARAAPPEGERPLTWAQRLPWSALWLAWGVFMADLARGDDRTWVDTAAWLGLAAFLGRYSPLLISDEVIRPLERRFAGPSPGDSRPFRSDFAFDVAGGTFLGVLLGGFVLGAMRALGLLRPGFDSVVLGIAAAAWGSSALLFLLSLRLGPRRADEDPHRASLLRCGLAILAMPIGVAALLIQWGRALLGRPGRLRALRRFERLEPRRVPTPIDGSTYRDSLDLAWSPAVDEDLRPLARFPELRHLNLQGTLVSSAGMREIAKLVDLESLHLSFTDVGDEAVEDLLRLARLKFLDLGSSRITDVGVRRLIDGHVFDNLHLGGVRIGREMRREVRRRVTSPDSFCCMPRLMSADSEFDAEPWIVRTDAEADEAGRSDRRIFRLVGPEVTDEAARRLTAARRMSRLMLAGTSVGDEGLRALADAQDLAHLTLSGEGRWTPEALRDLKERRPGLSVDVRHPDASDGEEGSARSPSAQ